MISWFPTATGFPTGTIYLFGFLRILLKWSCAAGPMLTAHSLTKSSRSFLADTKLGGCGPNKTTLGVIQCRYKKSLARFF